MSDEKELEEIKERVRIETIAELKKRKAAGLGKKLAVKEVSESSKTDEKQRRIQELVSLGKDHLIAYSALLGMRNIQYKRIDPVNEENSVKRNINDIASLVFYKEKDMGGKEAASMIVAQEKARRRELKAQKEERARLKNLSKK